MRLKKAFTQITTVLTLTCFLTTSAGLASPDMGVVRTETETVSLQLDAIGLPRDLGFVDEVFHGVRPEKVLLVQDAHCNFDAQKHIQEIIRYFQSRRQLNLVAFEGGAGELDLLLLKTFPLRESKEEVLFRYARRGELSGVELAAALNPEDGFYYAVENREIYEKNRRAFLDVYRNSGKFSDVLQTLFDAIDRLRTRYDSPALRELSEKENQAEENAEQLLDFIAYLSSRAREEGISLGDYPLFTGISAQADLEKELERGESPRSGQALELIRDAREKLSPILTGTDRAEFGAKNQDYQTGRMSCLEFLKYLTGLAAARGLELKNQEVFLPLVREVKEISALKSGDFFREIRALTGALKEKLFRNEEERLLDRLSRHASILRDLSRLEAVRDDFEYYRAFRDEFTPSYFEETLRRLGEPVSLPIELSEVDRFYRIALERDEILFGNLSDLMRKRGEDTALFVAGGFHTEGLKRRFREAGISYAVISPAIQDLGDPGTYLRVMKGEVSWREGERLRQGLEEKISSGNSRAVAEQLRNWRAAIINRALREGKIAAAGEYTRYVDALSEAVSGKALESALAAEVASLGESRAQFLEAVTTEFLTEAVGTVIGEVASGALSAEELSALLETRLETLLGAETLRQAGEERERCAGALARIETLRGKIREEVGFLRDHLSDLEALYARGEMTPEYFRRLFLDTNGDRKILARLLAVPETLPPVQVDDPLLEQLAAFDREKLIQAKIDTAEKLLGIKDEEALQAVDETFRSLKPDASLEEKLAYLEKAIELRGESAVPAVQAASLGNGGKNNRGAGRKSLPTDTEIREAGEIFWEGMREMLRQIDMRAERFVGGSVLGDIMRYIRTYRMYYLHSAELVNNAKEISGERLNAGVFPDGRKIEDLGLVSGETVERVRVVKKVLARKTIARITGHDPVLEEKVLRAAENYSREKFNIPVVKTTIPEEIVRFSVSLLTQEANRFLKELLEGPMEALEALPLETQEKLLDVAGNVYDRDTLVAEVRKAGNVLPRIEIVRTAEGAVTRIVLQGPFGDYRGRIMQRLTGLSDLLGLPLYIGEDGETGIRISISEVGRDTAIDFVFDHFDDLLRRMDYHAGEIDAAQSRMILLADVEGVLFRDGPGADLLQGSMARSVTKEALLSYLEAGGLLMLFSDEEAGEVFKRLTLEGADVPSEISGTGIPARLRKQLIVISNDSAIMSTFRSDGRMYEMREYRQGALRRIQPAKKTPAGRVHAAYLCGNCDPSRKDYPALKKMGTGWAVLVSENAPEGPEFQRNYLGYGETGAAAFLEAATEAARELKNLNPEERILFARKNLEPIIARAREILAAQSLGEGSSASDVSFLFDPATDPARIDAWLEDESRPSPFLTSAYGSMQFVRIAPGSLVLKILNLSATYLSEKEQLGILFNPLVRPFYSLARRYFSPETWFFWKEQIKRVIAFLGLAKVDRSLVSARGTVLADQFFQSRPDYPVKIRIVHPRNPGTVARIHQIPNHLIANDALWVLQSYVPRETFVRERILQAVRDGEVQEAGKIITGAIGHLFSALAPLGVMDIDEGIQIFENMALTDAGAYALVDWDAVTDDTEKIRQFMAKKESQIADIVYFRSKNPSFKKALEAAIRRNPANNVAHNALGFYDNLPADAAESLAEIFLGEVSRNFNVKNWERVSAQGASLGEREERRRPVVRPAERKSEETRKPPLIGRIIAGILGTATALAPFAIPVYLKWKEVEPAYLQSKIPEVFSDTAVYRIPFDIQILPVFLASVGIAAVTAAILQIPKMLAWLASAWKKKGPEGFVAAFLASALIVTVPFLFVNYIADHYNTIAIRQQSKQLWAMAHQTLIVFGAAEFVRAVFNRGLLFSLGEPRYRNRYIARGILGIALGVIMIVTGFFASNRAIDRFLERAGSDQNLPRSGAFVWDRLGEREALKDSTLGVRYGGQERKGYIWLRGFTGRMANRDGLYARADIRGLYDVGLGGGVNLNFTQGHLGVKEQRFLDASINLFGDGALFGTLSRTEPDLYQRLYENAEQNVEGGAGVFKQPFGTNIVAQTGRSLEGFWELVEEVNKGWHDPVIAGRRYADVLVHQTNGVETLTDLQRWNWNERTAARGYASDVMEAYRVVADPENSNRQALIIMQAEARRKWKLAGREIPPEKLPGRRFLASARGRSLGEELEQGGISSVLARFIEIRAQRATDPSFSLLGPMDRRTAIKLMIGGLFGIKGLIEGMATAQPAVPPLPDQTQERAAAATVQSMNGIADQYSNGVFFLTDSGTRLPLDVMRVNDDGTLSVFRHANGVEDLKTSPSNIGARLAAIVSALGDLEKKTDPDWEAKIRQLTSDTNRILMFLEKARTVENFYYRYYWLHPSQREANGMPRPDPASEISSVDNANLTAGMIAAAAFFEKRVPDYSERFLNLIRKQNYRVFYDPVRGLMTHGFRPTLLGRQGENLPNHYDLFFTEGRLLAFLGVVLSPNETVRGELLSAWDNLQFDSWGGSLFEYLFASVFLDEPMHGADFLTGAMRYAVSVERASARNGFWGRAPAYDEGGNYLGAPFGNPVLGMKGNAAPEIVAPYAWGLAAPFDFQGVNDQFRRLAAEAPGFFSSQAGGRDSFNPTAGRYPSLALSWDTDLTALGLRHALERLRGGITASDYFWRGLSLLGEGKVALGERLLGKGTERASENILDASEVGYRNVGNVRVTEPEGETPARRFAYDTTAGGAFNAQVYEQGVDARGYDILELEARRVGGQPVPKKFRIEIKKEGFPDRVLEAFGEAIGNGWTKIRIPLFKDRWPEAEKQALIREIVIAFWPGADQVGTEAVRGALDIRGIRFVSKPQGASLGAETPEAFAKEIALLILNAVRENYHRISREQQGVEAANVAYEIIRNPALLAREIIERLPSEAPYLRNEQDREAIAFRILDRILGDHAINQSQFRDVYAESLSGQLRGTPGSYRPYDVSRFGSSLEALASLWSLEPAEREKRGTELAEGILSSSKHSKQEAADLAAGSRLLQEMLKTEGVRAEKLGKIFSGPELMAEGKVQQLHEIIGSHVQSANPWHDSSSTILAGRYRWGDTHWGLHFYPHSYQIDQLMSSFSNWLYLQILNLDEVYQKAWRGHVTPQSEGMIHPAILLAAKAYNRFVEIHPFENGNGRVATLIADYVLLRYGYPSYIPAKENLSQLVRIGRFGEFDYDLLTQPYILWGATQPVDEERAAFFTDQILAQAGIPVGASLGGEPVTAKETVRADETRQTGNFRQFILNLLDEKYGTELSSARADGGAAVEFFFAPGTDRAEILKALEVFLAGRLDEYAGKIKERERALLPDFETLAKEILFSGLDRENFSSVLRNAKPDLTDGEIQSAIADIEGALGNAAITAAAAQSEDGRGVGTVIQELAAAPEEYLRAFNRLAEGWNLRGMVLSEEGPRGTAEGNLMLAVHIESLPQELQPVFVHALLQRLGERGTLFLIYPRKAGADERIRIFTGFLTPQEKAKVILRPYVEGTPLPFSTVASRMRQAGAGVGRAVVIPAFDEGMPESFERSGPVNFFEFNAAGVPGNIPDIVFSMILAGGENPELLKDMPPDVLAQKPVGGQGHLFAFNLVALAASLGDEIKRLRVIEQAA
ncbi:MAG TPA: Fic family protein [Candidatus Omnitrophota bacterium]|nr:Fic family protein [Candidatus Omnitrophota bacterium]